MMRTRVQRKCSRADHARCAKAGSFVGQLIYMFRPLQKYGMKLHFHPQESDREHLHIPLHTVLFRSERFVQRKARSQKRTVSPSAAT